MSSRELSVAQPSFDEILDAVQETDRGRWFLAEFRNRAQLQGVAQIEAAISRIEHRISSLPGAETESGEWARAKLAIAAARSDIARLIGEPQDQTDEKQVFAHLASLARQAFPQPENHGSEPAILRALQLVEELENTVVGTHVTSQAEPADSDRYFKADEHLFESSATLAQTAEAEMQPVVPRNAKLVVVGSENTTHQASVLTLDDALPQAAPEAATAHQAHAAEKDQRIFFVRRKPDELAEVPLLPDEQDSMNVPAA